MYFCEEEIVYEKTERQWNFIADGLYRGSSGNTVASIIYIYFKRKYFYGDSCVLSLVSNDVADGSVLFCNTIYPEKSKWPERRSDISGYIINKLYRMYALGAFFDYNGTSSMGGKVNEEKWILVYIFIWAIHVISSYVDSCWRNTVFEHERMDCLSGFMAGDGCCFKRCCIVEI